MTTSSSSDPGDSKEPQEALFDDEPKPNSPEDLGLVPSAHVYGKPTPEREPVQKTLSPCAIGWKDFRKFVDFIRKEEIPTHVDVTVGHCMTSLSGLGLEDLRWLCQAIRKIGRAPCPVTMKKAAIARRVRILGPGGDLEESQK